MTVGELRTGVYSVGAIDWDRRLFDELIPLPDGTTYNAYLIKGSEKNALIDTVDPSKEQDLLQNIKSTGVEKIDYLISNHAEQDHSGAIPKILKIYPETMVVTNAKCKSMLASHLLIPDDKFIEVTDRQTISLGNKTLEFVITPWVHWPETMLTYLKENKILFPCDLFGSHLASSNLYADDKAHVYRSAKRYYAEIMMPFSNNIKKHMEKLSNFDIEIIAPSHGPIHNNPEFILDAYKDWISDNVKNEVIIPYVSMHGSTDKMVSHLVNALIQRGIIVKPYNLTKTDIGELAMALVDAATIVIATPTVLIGPHPAVMYATYLANILRPKAKFAALIGSYGWGGKMPEIIKNTLSNLKVQLLNEIIVKGHPKQDDYLSLDKLADEILEKHKEIAIMP